MHMTEHGAHRLLDWLLTDSPVARPAPLYAGLSGLDGEISSAGYARTLVTFANGVNRQSSNTNELRFTASGANWPTLYYLSLFDAANGGNLLWYQDGLPAIEVQAGDSLIVPAGAITIQIVPW